MVVADAMERRRKTDVVSIRRPLSVFITVNNKIRLPFPSVHYTLVKPMKNRPNRADEVLKQIDLYREKHGYFPSADFLRKPLKLSKPMIYLYFEQLRKRGDIERNDKGRIIATRTYSL